MKKGQGLSMNVIIIAAIALLVLVIISVLVLRAGGNVNESSKCGFSEGQCVPSGSLCSDITPGTWITNPAKGCENEGDICCTPI